MKGIIVNERKEYKKQRKAKGQLEFIALMASLMAIISLAMEAVLPALDIIGQDIGASSPNQGQALITMLFLGMGIGQLLSGPLSDSLGRKPLVYYGFALFILSSFVSINATNIETMIVGRILQGLGLSAPRTISMAIVRDTYNGNAMAKIMSFIMVVFVITPAIAPSFGKLLLDKFNWEAIFISQIFIAMAIAIWFSFRQKETLKIENRVRFNMKLYMHGLRFFLKSRQAVIYTIILGIIQGGFLIFLSTAQNVLGEQYGLENEFPLLFASIVLIIGLSTLFNGVLVVRLGMHKLVITASIIFTFIAFVYVFVFQGKTNPSIYILMGFLSLMFLSFGFIIGNLASLAMEPLGEIAGIGSAIHGFVSTVISVLLAAYIGSFINETVFPLMVGFLITGLLSIVLFVIGAVQEEILQVENL